MLAAECFEGGASVEELPIAHANKIYACTNIEDCAHLFLLVPYVRASAFVCVRVLERVRRREKESRKERIVRQMPEYHVCGMGGPSDVWSYKPTAGKSHTHINSSHSLFFLYRDTRTHTLSLF